MCTVSYVPLENGFMLTSSRDEKAHRPTAIPQVYELNNENLIFPKDLQSGGTWIALAPTEKRMACLLNGAFENHQKKDQYRMSRGKVLLENFKYPNAEIFNAFQTFEDIEPFTLLLLEIDQFLKFSELRWDGTQKYFSRINIQKPKIWSSATLYDRTIREEREAKFENWLAHNNWKDIENFHAQKHGLSTQNDIIMKREEGLQTLSISQIHYQQSNFTFNYSDLVEQKTYSINA
ncbi:hypothetical protein Emtol_0228 (plasmid) [Emticicia oligotrophica DSM 17448]|uniref:Transport and Golgi organization protein 2 n=1 Tax=Emticicia oligotrophica (strain DSM 17448 / CIP 109782 / MTCC 6937 / GPTSA100-15) TaxID=929562 RepID=A0ABM5N7H6_EMTOG|nr:NRDE family protein [Emticicia oligotrophica]AFK05500.1 hypothetical protein Emtol_0228 [Emticicia oligotrophica DSM 17448]